MVKNEVNCDWKDTRVRRQVILDYVAGKIDRKSASIKLHTSVTYISTLKNKYLKYGDSVFTHGNQGKESSFKIPDHIEEAICELYETIHYDFTFQHFCDWTRRTGELMATTDGREISDRTIARILRRNGIRSPEGNKVKKGSGKIHPLRPRRAKMGELVQIDASLHDWFNIGEKWTIYTAIDDATSTILATVITKAETTEGYFTLFKRLIKAYGVPRTFYTDRRTTFVFNGDSEVSKKARVQFDQACRRLGVDIIKTSNAAAKGRVERGFRTLQQRLVGELRVLSIRDPVIGEEYLLKQYIPDHNKRRSKPPADPISAFRSLTPSEADNLDVILASRYARSILNGNVVSYKGCQYMPVDSRGNCIRIPGGETVFIADTGANIKLIHNNTTYEVVKFKDGFTSSPGENHPWRRWQSNKPNPRNES